ncbi:MAG: 7TM domain-containing protein [Candidatus Shapirobacteria bacterium]|nr:7TM domain-containing protein [Candidatus Shapirobacteria bacterium]
MKKIFFWLLLLLYLIVVPLTQAQGLSPAPTGSEGSFLNDTGDSLEATETIEIIASGERSEKITEPTEVVKGRLTLLLEGQEIGGINIGNFLKHAIRKTVALGIPANTIVLVFLLPLMATLITLVRYIFGVSGFGIFTPVMISVALIATGLTQGLVLFLVIAAIAILARTLLRKIRVHFLPRMSLLLWFVCLGVFALLLVGPQLGFADIADISIFPILIVILLVENFIEVLIGKNSKEALRMTGQTLVVAVFGYWFLSWRSLQGFVLLNPEIIFLSLLIVNLVIGRYSGLRWLEYRRFRSIFLKN